MKKNIYLAGKVKNPHYSDRKGGWRYELLKELFNVEIEIAFSDYERDFKKPPIISINNKFNYVGPFLYGCDHGCSHKIPYAHGVLTCIEGWSLKKPHPDIFNLSMKQIQQTDILILNFNELPLKTYGGIAETAFAFGLKNKKIYGLGKNVRDLWFVQSMCEMCKNVEELKMKLI